MKNKLLRYSLLLLLMLVGGVSSLWAVESTGTIKFGSAQGSIQIKSTSVTGADDLGNTWTITTEGTSSFTSSSLYYQVGSSSKPATSITFTMSLPQAEKVTSFSAKFGGFSGTAGDVSLKVGNTEVGSGALNATDDVTISSNESANGSVLTVTITNIAKGVKCYYISYTYGEADTRTATKITLGDYETTGKVGGSISIPTAIVSDNAGTPINGATVTWSSSDETVVSIDNTENKFKLLKPGISTIKAKYEGDATYQPCTTSFDLSVNADATFDFTSQSNWNIPSSGTNKDEKEFTDGTYTIKLYSTENYKLMAGYLIIGKANSYLEFPAFDFAVKKIEVVGHAGASSSVIQNIYVGETAVSTATTGANDVTNIYEIANNYQAAGNIYKLVITSSHNTQIEKIYVYKADTEEQPKQLFVIGDIATNGWDMTKMDELTYNSTTEAFEMECETTKTANFAFSKYQYETVNWDNFNDNDRLAIGNGNVAATLGTEYQLEKGFTAVDGAGPCVQIAAAGRYKISVTKDLKMTITQLEDTYVVAGAVGDEAESGKDDILFGKTWDVTANELTADATGILSKTFSNVSFDAATTINYKIVKNGNTWIPDGMDNNLTCDIPEAGKYNITVTFDPTTSTANMTAERLSISNVVLYSWNQGTEHLGKAVASDGESVGCTNAEYTTIRLKGKTFTDNYVITITLDKPLKAGDIITVTAYRNKDAANKTAGFYAKFDKGGEVKTSNGLYYVNIDATEASAGDSNRGTEPNSETFTVPDEADGSTVITLTRSHTGTNLWITKLEITGERDDCYTVAGSSEALFDTKWDAYNVKNELEKQADGTFKLVFADVTLNKGTIEYKIVKNNTTWIPKDNQTCAIPERGIYDVTVTFDPTTQEANMEAVKEDVAVDDAYVVAGAIKIGNGAEQAGFFTEAWDKEASANEMEKQTDGTYKKAYEDVTIAEGTTIYYKVVKNGETWIPENENLDYWVKKGGKFNITFTYDPQAQENPITILIEATTEGDANLDGKVTTSDAVAAVSFALEKEEASAEQRKAADFNKNNVITVTDAVAIVNVALEEDPTGAAPMFNAGENFLTLNGTALSLTNSTAFVAFQMDVTLTNGAVLNGVLPTERTQGLTLSFNRIGENTWRIVAFSIEKNAITGNEGDLLTFDITGSKTMTITNIEFADTYAIAYALGFNDGETTGIRPINNGQLTIDNVIYDLNGRRVQNPSKGVYVINGKKVVIK